MPAVLFLAGLLAVQEPARFTMAPEPGDTTTAEAFRIVSSDNVDAEAAGLLPGAGAVEVRSADGMNVARRAGTLPGGPVVVYAEALPDHVPEFICRMRRDPRGANENAERAFRWCLTFVTRMAPVLVLHAPTAQPPQR